MDETDMIDECEPVTAGPSAESRSMGTWAAAACVALLSIQVFLSLTAASAKGPTVDEPVHVLSGRVIRGWGDYGLNPEHPPAWKWWAALANESETFEVDRTDPLWDSVSRSRDTQWLLAVKTLFQTPGNDGDGLVQRSRFAMAGFGPLLGLVVVLWSWRVAGRLAAVVSCVLIALDPNVLAHSSLVTNDVALTFLFTAAAWLVWEIGRRITVLRVTGLGLIVGLAIGVKYSALILPAIVAVSLTVRAIDSGEWNVGRKTLSSRGSKLVIATLTTLVSMFIAWIVLWGCYGFRFAPTPSGVEQDPTTAIVHLAEKRARSRGVERIATTTFVREDVAAARRDPVTRAALIAMEHRVVPQAFAMGLVEVRAYTTYQRAYLMGEISGNGWWYYFPLAFLFKAPLSILLAIALGIGGTFRIRHADTGRAFWTVFCLSLPALVYGLLSLSSRMNIGVRHILPVLPFVYMGVGLAASGMVYRFGRRAAVILALLAITLAAESFTAYPDYIAFFNVAAGGSRGGLHLLGDSNLDWGQDLKQLARWQREHPDETLYLSYFGTADPSFYGIRYVNVPGGYDFGPPPRRPEPPGVFAVSATKLQGIYLPEELRQVYAQFRDAEPTEILGGTIYLYRLSEPDPARR